MVPFKLHFLRRCGGRLHGWLRSSATRKTGDSYKDLNVTCFFQVCLCKMGCKLPVLLRMKIPVPLKKKKKISGSIEALRWWVLFFWFIQLPLNVVFFRQAVCLGWISCFSCHNRKLFADARGQGIPRYSVLTYCNICYFYRNKNKNSIRSMTLLEAVIKMKMASLLPRHPCLL